MARLHIALFVVGVVLLAQATVPQHCLGGVLQPCAGKYEIGKKLSPAELQEILRQHAAWVKDGGPYHLDDPKVASDPRRASLCWADLSDADLSGADLRGAALRGAELWRAFLIGVDLWRADLRGAGLWRADLNGANLGLADLSDANLSDANLSDADLSLANLNVANLGLADLSGADLRGADLRGAALRGAGMRMANLAHAYLDVDPDALPKVSPGIASARNLQLIRFHDEPAALVKLRKEFKDLGLRTQENQLTYAIRRSELNRKIQLNYVNVGKPVEHYAHSASERFLNTMLFDWTCQYGMSPGRPVLLVAGFGIFFTIFYVLAQCFTSLGGIWVVWDETRINRTEGSQPTQRLVGFPYDPAARPRWRSRFLLSVVMLAAYFSLLSALRIGWSGLNFGTWITRMQLREYSLHATGWTRFASGLQSLISVLLVALAILTYFGTPFEY